MANRKPKRTDRQLRNKKTKTMSEDETIAEKSSGFIVNKERRSPMSTKSMNEGDEKLSPKGGYIKYSYPLDRRPSLRGNIISQSIESIMSSIDILDKESIQGTSWILENVGRNVLRPMLRNVSDEFPFDVWGDVNINLIPVRNFFMVIYSEDSNFKQVYDKIDDGLTVKSVPIQSGGDRDFCFDLDVEIEDRNSGLGRKPKFGFNIKVARSTAPQEIPDNDLIHSDEEAKEKLDFHFRAAAEQKALGALLAELRVQAGMTQAEIAKSMGTGPKAIRRIEKGEQSPSLRVVQRYASALGYHAEITLTPQE